MQQYHDLVKDVLETGKQRGDRTGTGTVSVFGRQIRFNLQDGFPLLTTKFVSFKNIVAELLWFIEGSTDNNRLAELSGVKPEKTIWAEWATKNGDLGPIYGKMWRSWPNPHRIDVDQLADVIHEIKMAPYSRRLIVSAWNPSVLPDTHWPPKQNPVFGNQALAPCHTLFQFYVEDGKLSCQLYQRSADLFLGVPYNIASYALLTHLVAAVCGLEVGEFIHTFGDAHIYLNHLEQVELMLSRDHLPAPTLWLSPGITFIDKYGMDDIKLLNYTSHPAIKAEVAV
jgi:thymidylate synthase